MKKYIFGMSKARRDLSAWIEDHTYPVMREIAKLYLFPDAPTRLHWRQEVWSKFNMMHPLRSTKRLPSANFIFESSWGVDYRLVHGAVKYAIGHELDFKPRDDIDEEELSDIMHDYFKWLSYVLSIDPDVMPQEVYDKLDELGL